MKNLKSYEEFVNEFGPLAGSGNTRANDLDNTKRRAAKKSERGKTVYVVGGKYGSYKLSNRYVEGNTYAVFVDGSQQDLDLYNK